MIGLIAAEMLGRVAGRILGAGAPTGDTPTGGALTGGFSLPAVKPAAPWHPAHLPHGLVLLGGSGAPAGSDQPAATGSGTDTGFGTGLG